MPVDVEVVILPDGTRIARVYPKGIGKISVIETGKSVYVSRLPDISYAIEKAKG